MIATFALDRVEPAVLRELQERMAYCETLRGKAVYNTGSISEAAAVYLRALCDEYQPKTIIEIGTFIGTSTMAMASADSVATIMTCDKDNDCLPDSEKVRCHPYMTSTQLLASSLIGGITADFFFFDGRIQGPDIALILRLSQPRAIYVFDDYERREKGVINVEMLRPYLKDYTLMLPPTQIGELTSKTSIAVLLQKDMV